MIIDCHGHYTTSPPQLQGFRDMQIAHFEDPAKPAPGPLNISDDEIRESIEKNQLGAMRERGADMTIFSPRAVGMGHHIGDEAMSHAWGRVCNDMIHRVVQLYPDNFAGVCQLPQSPGVPVSNSIGELERCVNELGFVGCNLNPDPSGGLWQTQPLTDREWYPFYEKLVELDVPAMIHVSGSCNPNFHHTGAHYINADTTAFMQFIQGDLFKDFPDLRLIIPHGGGAVPYHWGRYRGLADMMKKPEDGFDYFDPANVAPLVVWLGSEDSKTVTGRIFEVEGGKLSIADGWRSTKGIDKGARWEPAEVGGAVDKLLAEEVPPQKVYGA